MARENAVQASAARPRTIGRPPVGTMAPRPPGAVARTPSSAVWTGPPVVPAHMAYDPGYATIGAVPVFVQAKPSWSRPGTVTGAATIGFVLAGLSLVAGIFWLFASDATPVVDDRAGYLLRGVADVAITLALVLGGIGLMARQAWGRIALAAGAAVDASLGAYHLSIGWYWSLAFVVLDVVIVALAFMPATARFLATSDPRQAFR